jgi:hypothetical protein
MPISSSTLATSLRETKSLLIGPAICPGKSDAEIEHAVKQAIETASDE